MESSSVNLACIKEGSRLRVRITSPGYLNTANCQFPRAIRAVGAKYAVPASAVTLASGPAGKYFYRIKKSEITILKEKPVSVKKIFEEGGEECVICMVNHYDRVIVPCGHFCLCVTCVTVLQRSSDPRCPMCRGSIEAAVSRDEIG